MNKLRRKEISAVVDRLNSIAHMVHQGNLPNTRALFDDAVLDIECILHDEEDYRDNIPENLQNGYRYEMSEEACDNIESSLDVLRDISDSDKVENIIDAINEAVEYLNDAT